MSIWVTEQVSVSEAPFPEPVLLEQEGTILNGNSFGFHKQHGHQNRLHNHTACKEEECAPLQCTTPISQPASHSCSLILLLLSYEIMSYEVHAKTCMKSGSRLLSLSACHGIVDIVCSSTQIPCFHYCTTCTRHICNILYIFKVICFLFICYLN